MDGILPPHEKSDMALVTAIPGIIAGGFTDIAENILAELPFWYSEATNRYSQVFWTENHYIMYASSAYILSRFLGMDIDPVLRRRLDVFLELKASVGMAEFLSPVYYPFTIASLLNLYDYSRDDALREMADRALKIIAGQLLAVSLPDGKMISPSARSYERHRLASSGQHIHQFINFLFGFPIGGSSDQALHNTLTTTTWRYEPRGRQVSKMSLTSSLTSLIDALDRIIGREQEDIYVSMLWSYGVYVPPDAPLRRMVVSFMDDKGLWDHPHFRPMRAVRRVLACCPSFWIGLAADSFLLRPYVEGLRLTGASLTTFREGRVILSSLASYNEGLPCFQQWPWMVNLSGVVVWCGFGDPSSRQGLAETSSAKVLPIISHRGNVLVANYNARNLSVRISNINTRPLFRWPIEDMDEAWTTATGWVVGRKDSAIMGYKIRYNRVCVAVRDLAVSGTTAELFEAHLESFDHF